VRKRRMSLGICKGTVLHMYPPIPIGFCGVQAGLRAMKALAEERGLYRLSEKVMSFSYGLVRRYNPPDGISYQLPAHLNAVGWM
jgi:hypothetical protein